MEKKPFLIPEKEDMPYPALSPPYPWPEPEPEPETETETETSETSKDCDDDRISQV